MWVRHKLAVSEQWVSVGPLPSVTRLRPIVSELNNEINKIRAVFSIRDFRFPQNSSRVWLQQDARVAEAQTGEPRHAQQLIRYFFAGKCHQMSADYREGFSYEIICTRTVHSEKNENGIGSECATHSIST